MLSLCFQTAAPTIFWEGAYALLKVNSLVIALLFLELLWNDLSPAAMLQGQNQGLH